MTEPFTNSPEFDDQIAAIEWHTNEQQQYLSNQISLRPSLGGWGVFAKSNIFPGDVLIATKKKLVLSPQSCGIANLLEEAEVSGMVGLTLAFMFERAQGEASPWFKFIKSIDRPESVSSNPRLWSDEEKKYLAHTQVEEMGGLDCSEIEEVYADVVEPFVKANLSLFERVPSNLTYEGYREAQMVVSSRAFEVDTFHSLGLVPMACLFNHSDNNSARFETTFDVCSICGAEECYEHIMGEFCSICETTDCHKHNQLDMDMLEKASEHLSQEFVPDLIGDSEESDSDGDDDVAMDEEYSESCVVKSTSKIKAGDEIFNTYGPEPNYVLVSRYGFAIWANDNETLSLKEQVKDYAKTSEDLQKRLSFYKKNYYTILFGIDPDTYDDLELSDDSPPPPDELTWRDTLEVTATGSPSVGLRICLNILAMSSKKALQMVLRAKNGNFSSVPQGNDGARLYKELLQKKKTSYGDGNMGSKVYKKVIDGLESGQVREKLAAIVRGTEKLVIERALKAKFNS